MGKPIKKKWFTAKFGSAVGNIALTTTTGVEEIIKQVGTGVYEVASGRVKLKGGAPVVSADPEQGIIGDAQLNHEGRDVIRVNQYRLTYVDDTDEGTTDDAVWRDIGGSIIGTLVPAPVAETSTEPGGPGAVLATATATQTGGVVDTITVTNGGGGYSSAPTVTITGGPGTGATATAVLSGDTIGSINLLSGGTDYTDPVTVTIGDPVVVTGSSVSNITEPKADYEPVAKAKKTRKAKATKKED